MGDKLSRKQVLALSRALKRKGRKLPAVGRCAILPKAGARGRARGSAGAGEVCHGIEGGKHVYRLVGGEKARKVIDKLPPRYTADTSYGPAWQLKIGSRR